MHKPVLGRKSRAERRGAGLPLLPSTAAALPFARWGHRRTSAWRSQVVGRERPPATAAASSIAFVSANCLHFEELEALSPGWRRPNFSFQWRGLKNREIGISADTVLLMPSVFSQLYTTPVCSFILPPHTRGTELHTELNTGQEQGFCSETNTHRLI